MKKYLDKIILGVSIALALVAIFMMFAPAVAAKVGDTTYSGFEAAFGKSETHPLLGKLKILDASAAILPLLLLIIGICLTVVALLGKGGIIVPIAAAVVFVISGVLYFMSGLLLSPHYYQEYYGEMFPTKSDYVKYLRENFNIGVGAIVGGVFSILAGLAAAVPVVLKKIK
ncbi:MAG: hypothetical protein K2I30_01030 [Clostridia bacterium]|nr:hypothetical protein [Clostridia bacterium]